MFLLLFLVVTIPTTSVDAGHQNRSLEDEQLDDGIDDTLVSVDGVGWGAPRQGAHTGLIRMCRSHKSRGAKTTQLDDGIGDTLVLAFGGLDNGRCES